MKSFISISGNSRQVSNKTQIETNSSGLQAYIATEDQTGSDSLIRFYYEWVLKDSDLQDVVMNEMEVTSEEEEQLREGTT